MKVHYENRRPTVSSCWVEVPSHHLTRELLALLDTLSSDSTVMYTRDGDPTWEYRRVETPDPPPCGERLRIQHGVCGSLEGYECVLQRGHDVEGSVDEAHCNAGGVKWKSMRG